jgi:hypothetical protein
MPVNRCDLTRWMRDFPPPCKTPSIPSGTIYGERSRDIGPVPGARYSRWERPIIGVSGLFAGKWLRAPATMNDERLADGVAANLFRLPRLHLGTRLGAGSLATAGPNQRYFGPNTSMAIRPALTAQGQPA